MKKTIRLLLLSAFILSACNQNKPIFVQVMPTIEGAKLNLVGYATNEKFELLSQLYYFDRVFAGKDTMNGKPVYFFESNNMKTPFYTDDKGTVWQLNKEDLSARILPYQLITPDPTTITYWEPLLKIDDGEGTEWSISVDTTFSARNYKNEVQQVQYIHAGKARYEGWTEVTVPDRKNKPYRVMDVYWYELKNCFINKTTGDTLFAQIGKARNYFEPTLGAIRYMTDFDLIEHNKKTVFRRGTWELVGHYIPNKK